MRKILTILAVTLIVGGLAFHFARLQLYNFLVPKDAASSLVASDISYGPGVRQTLDVFKPNESKAPVPVVVFVHGGSWEEGNKDIYTFAGRALAANGFLTIVVNYRLHPKDRYPAFVEDVALALRWAAENAESFGGDPDKIFALGHSAGAYNVAMAVLDAKYDYIRPKLAGVITLAGPFDFVPLDSPITIKVFGAVPDLPSTQPVNHARADAPPFLILHGQEDKTVLPRNAVALDKALREVGAVSTMKIYRGVAHADMVMSLSIWLRGRAQTLGDVTRFVTNTAQ